MSSVIMISLQGMRSLERSSENYEIMSAALYVKFVISSMSCVICLEIRSIIWFYVVWFINWLNKRFYLAQIVFLHSSERKGNAV